MVSDTAERTLTVNTTCGWLLSVEGGSGDRLASGPYVGSRTVYVYDGRVQLQLSCSDGESSQQLSFPLKSYLPLVLR